METLAYLHLALAAESPTSYNTLSVSPVTLDKNCKLCIVTILAIFGWTQINSSVQAATPTPQGEAIEQYYRKIYSSESSKIPSSNPPCNSGTSQNKNTQKSPNPESPGIGGVRNSKPILTANPLLLASALQRGDEGESVSSLQQTLTQLGFYDGPITGLFGALTEEALKRFQQAQGLTPDGVYGVETQAVLQRLLNSVSSSNKAGTTSASVLQRGDEGERVTTLQNALKAAGVYDGPVTGVFGALTETAVIRFQQMRGLTADGIAGGATLAALQPSPTSVTPANPIEQLNVLELQKRLKTRGFYQGTLDGIWGPQTQAAIAAAQRYYGINEAAIRQGRF